MHDQQFTPPITGRLTVGSDVFDIYGPMSRNPLWIAYPAGAGRKERKRLDIQRRKAARKMTSKARQVNS